MSSRFKDRSEKVCVVSSDTDSEDENKLKVWSKGEACLAPYSGDGELYHAHIKKLSQGCGLNRKVYALVKFDDYDSDENEEMPVSCLKAVRRKCGKKKRSPKEGAQSANNSMFKPLSGNEEYLRLEGKFENYGSDSDEGTRSYTPQSKGKVSEWKISLATPSQISQRKKKSAVATGGGKKKKSQGKAADEKTGFHDSQEPSTSTGGITKPNKNKQEMRSDKLSRINADREENSTYSGFSEEDMEKPKFSFTPTAAKVPFLLSDRGEKPIIQVPATVNQYLRDYQREGIKFLYSHYREGRGAILGDDMGLGKTVQVIGLLAALLQKQGNRVDIMRQKPKFIRKLSDSADILADINHKPFLIIGPGSVLYNWLDELETWGYFTTSKFHGADKQTCLAEVKKGKLEVVVTTFETFRDNMEALNTVEWEAVIVDEVHRIKGLRAQTTQALRCVHTQKRYGLTGTALQNNMTELWSILDWAQPQVLGTLGQFEIDFVQVIERGQRHDATKRELALARKKKEEFSNRRLAMMIRRTKKIIADQLPEKDDNVVFCKLTPLQESVYRAVLGHCDMSLVMRMDDPCDCESRRKRSKCCYKELPDGSKITSVMFSFMHLLLKTANHVALLTPHANSSDQQKRRTHDICNTAFKDHPQFLEQTREASFRTLSDPKFCGKMKVLQGLLHVFYKSHSKVLVFSYSTRLLDILEQYVIGNGHEYRRIDGSVNNRRRMDIVREFNKDPSIFVCLISTKAGGLGLNLTGANKVVIFDPNWNPSHDLQAQDRAYRIGQRKNVAVYRLISVGTIEENIYLRQIYKQQLGNVAVSNEDAKRFFHGIQGDRFHKGELFGVKNMFQLRTGDSCLTMDILERNEKVEAGLRGFAMSKFLPPPSENADQEEGDQVSSDEEDNYADLQSDDESEDALRHLLDTDNDSGLDVASPPPSPIQKSTPVTKPTGKKKGVSKSEPKKNPNLAVPDVSTLQSFASVNSVFEKCGVMHVHENPKVIGTSRAEEHMSRRAIQAVYELHQNSQVPAMEVDPISESSEEEEPPPPPPKRGRGRGRSRKPEPDHNTPRIVEHGISRILIGQTPGGIKRQHFAKMADSEGGSGSQMNLAERIVGSDTETRLSLLREFYTKQYPDLEEVLTRTLTAVRPVDEEMQDKGGSSVKKRSNPVKKSQEKKMRGRLKKAKQGLTFLDSENSESQSIPEPQPGPCRLDQQESDLSSMEVGRSRGHRGMTTRTRTPHGRKKVTQTQSIAPRSVAEETDSLFDSVPSKLNKLLKKPPPPKIDEDAELTFSETVKVERDRCPIPLDLDGLTEPEDVENLLVEIGQGGREKQTEEENKADDSNSNISILDDIFSNASTKRKPAPPKASKNENSCDLFSPKSSASETDLTSDLLNESTLVDDSIDCFSEHRKWKKRKNSPMKSPVKRVNRLLQESNEDFEKLLESGKLRKKHGRSRVRSSFREMDDIDILPVDNQSPNANSASLFS